MTIINLRDFYPWYINDEYIEVSDETAAELRADKLYEAAYQRRIKRNKSQYSLNCDDGIEYLACLSEPTPQELLERMDRFLPSLECAQFSSRNAGPTCGRLHNPQQELPGGCSGGRCERKLCPRVREMWIGEHEEIFEKSLVIYPRIWMFFVLGI